MNKAAITKINYNLKGYGLGLAGVINKEMATMKSKWKDKNDKDVVLIIVNANKTNKYGRANSYFLNYKNFNSILNTNYSKKEIKEFKLEKISGIISELNEISSRN